MRRTERAAYRTKFYPNLSPPTRFDKETKNKPNPPKIVVPILGGSDLFKKWFYNFWCCLKESDLD